jgi:hypothetical protein
MPRFLPSVSSIAILVCSPAVAQVSAADLWAEWQATSAAMGQQMTATVTQTADGLVLENFVTRTEADGTTTTGTLDRVTMTEQADGSVSVEISNPYTATIMFPEDVGGPMITSKSSSRTKGWISPPPARPTRGPMSILRTSSPSPKAISATTGATRRPRSTWKSSPATSPRPT